MTTVNGETLLTPDELAKRWKINTQTLANWRSQETKFFKHVKIGNNVRYRLRDVEEYESREE